MTNLETAARAALEALIEAEGELYQVPPADFEQVRVLGVVRTARAALEAALAVPVAGANLRDVIANPGTPSEAELTAARAALARQDHAAFRPLEGHLDEIVWLRGYEAGVVAMRPVQQTVRRAALEEAARVADTHFRNADWPTSIVADEIAVDIRALADKEPTDAR
jgi:hypothetical protein